MEVRGVLCLNCVDKLGGDMVEKPKTVIFKDGEMDFKEVCVMFNAQYAWLDGVKYKLPTEKWKEDK